MLSFQDMNKKFYSPEKVEEAIRRYCERNGIPKREFACRIGILPPSLSRITAGKCVSIETLARIAALCGVSVREMLSDEI